VIRSAVVKERPAARGAPGRPSILHPRLDGHNLPGARTAESFGSRREGREVTRGRWWARHPEGGTREEGFVKRALKQEEADED